MTTEAHARAKTDAMLQTALYVVQNRDELNLHADPGVVVRKVLTPSSSPANILLFHEKIRPAPSAARCTEILPLVVRTIPQGDRTTAC